MAALLGAYRDLRRTGSVSKREAHVHDRQVLRLPQKSDGRGGRDRAIGSLRCPPLTVPAPPRAR